MSKYLNPEAGGTEKKNKRKPHERPEVKQMYCPRDGHYCEQPSCADCMAEGAGSAEWEKTI